MILTLSPSLWHLNIMRWNCLTQSRASCGLSALSQYSLALVTSLMCCTSSLGFFESGSSMADMLKRRSMLPLGVYICAASS